LEKASQRNGRQICLLSDESYREIVYDRLPFFSPVAYYSVSIILYTYEKILLTPGQRIGYIALPPAMPDKVGFRAALTISQFVTAYAFPNALMQNALSDLQSLSIDLSKLQLRRDRMVGELKRMGYELDSPQGTFYVLVRSPFSDDLTFCDLLADQNVYCLPRSVFEMPGYFRISLTANDDMVDRALPGFKKAMELSKSLLPMG
jgi:aspartate aminotransferase